MNYPKQVIAQLFLRSGLRLGVSGGVCLLQSPEAENLYGEIRIYTISKKVI